MNILEKNLIKSKIVQREQVSKAAGVKALKISNNNEKEKLINQHENETFFLHKDNKDHLKERAMDKYKNQQAALTATGKFIQPEKAEVQNYYNKYVE